MKKLFLFVCLCLFTAFVSEAQPTVQNYVFAHRDSVDLSMDVYTPEHAEDQNATVIFLFGGGFLSGSKSLEKNVCYCEKLAAEGFVVVAIDYRLGMKGVNKVNPYALKCLRKSIDMGVEDLYDATQYLIAHAEELKIDTGKIVLNGSSAGAVIALHADHELANQTPVTSVLPDDFRYAGVVSFAGGILSYEGRPKYNRPPAPTLFFHGMKDKLVTYKRIQIFNIGFFGANPLVKHFNKSDYPYCVYRYRNMGHEIANIPMTHHIGDVVSFINDYVMQKRPLETDITIKDCELKRTYFGTPRDIREVSR